MTGWLIRLSDLAIAGVLFVVLALPMLAIAAAIRLSDGGPALFRQERVGRAGRRFTVLKFRTMRVDRDGSGSGARVANESIDAAAARFKRTEPGDPRITRAGKLLRPSHLDELPQLLNVLAGDMSLVGVRPDTPVQEGDYTPAYWQLRHRFAPGLTGPAQLRSDPLTFDQRNAEELRWIEGRSLAMYWRILLRTAAKVMRRSSF